MALPLLRERFLLKNLSRFPRDAWLSGWSVRLSSQSIRVPSQTADMNMCVKIQEGHCVGLDP